MCQQPKVGAQCGNSARWDLRGGRLVKGRPYRNCGLSRRLLVTCKLVDVNPEKYLETVTRPAILTLGAVLLSHEYAAEIAARVAVESTEPEKSGLRVRGARADTDTRPPCRIN